MKVLRRILLILDFLLLLVVPYSFLAYVCYLGLCPGAPVALQRFTAFYGYYTWIYFLVIVGSLIFYFIVKNKNERNAFIALCLPVIGLLPLIFVECNVWLIGHQLDVEQKEMHSAKPADYVCAPGKFIRKEGGRYSFYDYNEAGDSGSIAGYSTREELKSSLASQGIVLETCKNQSNETL